MKKYVMCDCDISGKHLDYIEEYDLYEIIEDESLESQNKVKIINKHGIEQLFPKDIFHEIKEVDLNNELYGAAVDTIGLEYTKALISKGADMNYSENGDTVFFVLAISGQWDVVEFFLDIGANIEIRDNGGYTPLSGAVQGGHLLTASILIERGADLNAKTNYGASLMTFAKQADENSDKMVELLNNPNLARKYISGEYPSDS